MKRCPRCGTEKPTGEFYNNKAMPDGLYHYCKPCARARVRADYLSRYAAMNRHTKRAYDRHRVFGITQEDYERMLAAQGGLCAICRQPESVIRGGRTISLAVDHDHRTGRIRGLLCAACNKAIGYARDDPSLLQAAIAYLNQENPNDDGVSSRLRVVA